MTEENKARWQKVGRTLKGVGVATIGGYLEGGLIGAGAGLLRQFFQDNRGINLPSNVADIDPDLIEKEISSMESADFIKLKRIDAELEMREIEAEVGARTGFEGRYQAELGTESKFLWLIRPGLTIYCTLLTTAMIALALFWEIPESKSVYFNDIFANCFEIMKWAMAFWFSWRGVEKVTQIATNKKSHAADLIRGIGGFIKRRREEKEKERLRATPVES